MSAGHPLAAATAASTSRWALRANDGDAIDHREFTLDGAGQEKTVYAFNGAQYGDSDTPYAHLLYLDGAFYGTTAYGGNTTYCNGGETVPSGCGTVFKVTPGGTETVIYAFKGATEGANPFAGLRSLNGKLYGVTVNGGTDASGTVFDIVRKTHAICARVPSGSATPGLHP